MICFLTNALASGIILFTSLILFSTSDWSVSYLVCRKNPVVSILYTVLTNLLHSVFLTTSFFTALLNLVKSLGTGINLAISNLSTSVFKLARFLFDTKLLRSTCVTFFKSVFVT